MNNRSLTMDRRTLLKGLGAGAAGLGAGFLNSPVARGQTTEAPVRVLLVALQHGWGVDRSFDRIFTGSEFDFQIPVPLQGFEAIRDQCVFVDGCRGTLWGNAHDVSYSDILTAAVPWDEHGSDQLGRHFPEPTGPSLDWVIGQHHQKPVFRVSAGYRSWGVSAHPLSFDDRARLQPAFASPRAAFDAIIDPLRQRTVAPDPGATAVRDGLFRFLGRDGDRLLQRVRGTERDKLEDYVMAVDDLGRRLSDTPSVEIAPEDLPDRPSADAPFETDVDAYLDMIRLVFRADTHRAAVLGLGEQHRDFAWTDENGNPQVGNIWDNGFHHAVAHHSTRNDPSLNPRYAYEAWVDWYVQRIVRFTQTLAATPDVDGRSLLDNTIIVLTGDVGTGNHDTREKLHTIIGGGGGIRRGRWIETPRVEARNRMGHFIGGETRDGTRVESGLSYGRALSAHHTADLLTSVARLAGVPLDSFGLSANNWRPIDLT